MAVYPKNWEKVACCDWWEDKNKIWLCLEDKNAICEIDKKSKEVKILGYFPHNVLGENNLSLSVKKNGDFIVFCPFNANDIAILKMSTGELEFIDLSLFLDKSKYIDIKFEKFYRMISYKKYILFFGIKYPTIMRLDLTTKKLEFFDGWLTEVEKHTCKEAVFFTDGHAQKGNVLCLPIGRCNGILKVNLDTMQFHYIELDMVAHGILGMTQKDNFVWLTEHDAGAKKFFQWNMDNDSITQIDLPCRDAFYAPLYYKKSLLFFPNIREKGYQYELETKKWKEITNLMPDIRYASDKKVMGEEIKYFSIKSKKIYRWNPETNKIDADEFQINGNKFLMDSWMKYCERMKREKIQEGRLVIGDYIEEIKSFPIDLSEERKNTYDIGYLKKKEIRSNRQIWEMLKIRER